MIVFTVAERKTSGTQHDQADKKSSNMPFVFQDRQVNNTQSRGALAKEKAEIRK